VFTGIIEEVGKIKAISMGSSSAVLTIGASKVLENTKLGDSIAVNGVCLTVTKLGTDYFTADVMAETIRRSSLGTLTNGSPVNLERAMAADGRFGGHIVSGHVDSMGTIASIVPEDNAIWYTINAEAKTLHYIVEKGSITIDGISLTVAYVDDSCFKVSIIPHTRQETNLSSKGIGDKVNLECDIIGKYVEKLLTPVEVKEEKQSNITEEFLRKYGF
jgi:riboflavin synthase